MARMITQQDLALLHQSQKTIFAKVELLNQKFKVIDSIEGNLISDSFSCDGTSAVRRTYQATLQITDSSFQVGKDRKFWFDKRIRPYVGFRYCQTDEIVWYLMGTYVLNDANASYDAETKTLSLSCSDLMSTLNGERNGIVTGYRFTITAGDTIRNVIVTTLELADIKKYLVAELNQEVGEDLEFSAGTTYYEILNRLIELYPGYEMYFDISGTLIIDKIPSADSGPSVLDDSILDKLVIGEQTSYRFNEVKNVTELYGKTFEVDEDHYTAVCTYSNGVYTITLPECGSIANSDKIGIKIPAANESTQSFIRINELEPMAVVKADGSPIAPLTLQTGNDYTFRYQKKNNTLLYLGQYQIYARYEYHEPGSPYSIEELGEILQVFSGGDYDIIFSDELAMERAQYETWLKTNQLDTISLDLVTIPFLEPNLKIDYTPSSAPSPRSYLVQSFSGSLTEGTMNVTLQRVYPEYSLPKNKKHPTFGNQNNGK